MYANNCASTSNKKDEEVVETNNITTSLYNVYPNPSEGGFYINSTTSDKQNLLVELFDMTGKKVFSQACSFNWQICYFNANVSSGLYLVKVINTDNNEPSLFKILFAS